MTEASYWYHHYTNSKQGKTSMAAVEPEGEVCMTSFFQQEMQNAKSAPAQLAGSCCVVDYMKLARRLARVKV